MKNVLIVTVIALFISGCSSNKPPVQNVTPEVHQETIGSVHITFDDTGNWIKLVSTGVAPTHNQSAQAISEASKIASMRAKQNIAEFMNNDVRSDKTVEVVTKSVKHASSGSDKNAHENNVLDNPADSVKTDDEIRILTSVVERIRDSSNAILRGVQTTAQTVTNDQVEVEVSVSRQTISASQNLRASMNGTL